MLDWTSQGKGTTCSTSFSAFVIQLVGENTFIYLLDRLESDLSRARGGPARGNEPIKLQLLHIDNFV